MDVNTPQMAWFAPPEGIYTLITSLNVPSALSTNSSTAHFLGSSAPPPPPPPAAGTAPSEIPPIPPPLNNTRLSVVSIRFPLREAGGGGLGMSMGSLRGPRREASGSESTSPGFVTQPLPSVGATMDSGMASSNEQQSPGAPLSSLPSSALAKRKQLSSSFSIPTLSSLSPGQGNSNGDGTSTSRPIRQFRGTSSSFVRSWEGLPLSAVQLRGLAEGNVGKAALFGFYTTGQRVVWCEIGQGRPKDALCRVTFSVAPTCIDVNQHTATSQQLDVLVGFVSGDIFWFDPLSAKYTRINKGGIITSSPITSIQWLPPSTTRNSFALDNKPSHFLTSHADGTMLIWDRDREDWSGFSATPAPSAHLRSHGTPGKENELNGSSADGSTSGSGDKHAPVSKELPAGTGDLIVTTPAPVDKKGVGTSKFNPVSHWRVSKKAIKAFTFSPDLKYCATVGDDGCLRIIDLASEKLLDTFAGYFGALTCVAWSPEGRFVVTGGEDDLCTVYAPLEQRLVARCQGHSSFVTGVAWDPWRSDDRTMRFASVGEDCKLIVWDLSSASLSRPKTHATSIRRHSAGSTFSLPRRRAESTAHLPSPLDQSIPTDVLGPIFHPAPRRTEVSILQPTCVKVLSNDLFASLLFLPDFLVTASRTGQVKLWDRPPVEEEGEERLRGMRGEFCGSVVRIDARAR